MSFSKFLDSRRENIRELVKLLRRDFSYVSVLGVDVKSRSIRADRATSNISNGRDTECGFVVKMSRGSVFFEYSMEDITGDMSAFAASLVDPRLQSEYIVLFGKLDDNGFVYMRTALESIRETRSWHPGEFQFP